MTSKIRYHEYNRKSRIDAEKFDRFYTKFTDFQEDMGILTPKIEGKWKLVFVDLRYPELCQLQNMEISSNWEISVYARKETLVAAKALDPSKQVKPFEEFMKVKIANFKKPIDDKSANEIFRRCGGDLELIDSVLSSLAELPASKIRIEEVNSVVAANNMVWASDVVASVFIFYNDRVPKRGHPLAGFKWKKPIVLLDSLVQELGQEIAFYAIQKQLRFLYETKVKYIHNDSLGSLTKQQENLLYNIDIHSIFYAYALFRLSTPPALFGIVIDILNRQSVSNEEVSLLNDIIHQR